MDVATMAPTAAAAMATIIIERKDRSRMNVSFSLQWTLLQWIVFDAHKIGGDVFGGGVRTFAFRKVELLRAQSVHQSRQTVISFVAARLVIDPVLLVALPRGLLLYGPGP